MGLLRSIALTILGLSGLIFIALFGRLPAFRKTPVAFLYKTIWIYIPNGIIHVDSFLLRGRFIYCWNRSGRYLLHENHPLVLLLFLAIMIGGKILFLPAAWPNASATHHVLIPGIAIAPYIFLYASVVTKPFITPKNHAEEMQRYPYDGIIFHQGQQCRTCRFLKPARSKHCSICKACVSRHDHHCVWLVNCVGRHNYRYFLSLLLSLSVMLVYATYLGYVVLCQIRDESLPSASDLRMTGQDWRTLFNFWCVIIVADVRIGMVFILTVLTAPLAMAFLVYHTYLVWAGTTTNESSKWAEVKDDVADGLVFRSTQRDINGEATSVGRSPRSWPGRSAQILIFTDGHPPTEGLTFSPASGGVIQEGKPDGQLDRRWTRVRSMRDVDNIYDIGFWDNLRDALNLPIRRQYIE